MTVTAHVHWHFPSGTVGGRHLLEKRALVFVLIRHTRGSNEGYSLDWYNLISLFTLESAPTTSVVGTCKPKFSVLGVHGSIKSPKAEGADIQRWKGTISDGSIKKLKAVARRPFIDVHKYGIRPQSHQVRNPSMTEPPFLPLQTQMCRDPCTSAFLRHLLLKFYFEKLRIPVFVYEMKI